jgi:hypothetical protein
MQMDATGLSNMLVPIYGSTWQYLSEGSNLHNVQFGVLTGVVMKSSIFWDTMCSPLKVNQHFRRACRLHLQGRRVSQARNQRESRSRHAPPKRQFTLKTIQHNMPKDTTLS